MQEELIPLRTDSYDSLTFIHTKCASVYKKVGYTPLQVVRDILPYLETHEADKITYVGRLDPMAEGWMHILWNGVMEEKATLASKDKVYEIEVVCGVSTDTGDVLGLIKESKIVQVVMSEISTAIKGFVGPFTYAYPKYSSPNIKDTLKGKEKGEKLQKGNIQKVEEIGVTYIESGVLQKEIEKKLSLSKMDGDFRLNEIKEKWKEFFADNTNTYVSIKLRVDCSSGTYMRTLAEELGRKICMPAYAHSIKRIGIKDCLTKNK